MTADEMKDFRGYLKNCTDRQVQGVYDKEKAAGREDYAELAVAEAECRGITIERSTPGDPAGYNKWGPEFL